MSIGDWIGVVSLILSVPLGIASNLLAPRILAYLEERKLVKQHRTRDLEVAHFRRVQDFKTGKRDKYAFYALISTMSVISANGAFACLVIALVKGDNFSEPGLILTGTLFLLVSLVFLLGIATTARHLEQFDEYKAQIRAKWGDDAV